DLVLLGLEPAEEPEDARELLVALEYQPALGLVEPRPGHVERDPAASREALQLVLEVPVVRLVPGLDRALAEAPGLVGHDQVEVELDEVAEAVARRAGAEGVVEGEEPGLGLEEALGAARALEAVGEGEPRAVHDLGQRLPRALGERGLERVGEARAR